jgi:hypothetical protein
MGCCFSLAKLKRVLALTVGIAIIALFTQSVFAAPYFLFGKVFNADGTTGTAATANSFAGLTAIRAGINGQLGVQNNGPNPTFPNQIYPSYYNNVTIPATFYSDVGSTNWTTAPGLGQSIVTLVQVYSGQFGWAGNSYVGAHQKIISSGDLTNSETDMQDTGLALIPAPQASAIHFNDLSLTWAGLNNDPDNLITGYTVYRSLSSGSGYSALTLTAGQTPGGTVTYADSGLTTGTTYYYKIAVNYTWGGGNGAPSYMTTTAQSAVTAVTTNAAVTGQLIFNLKNSPSSNITVSTGQNFSVIGQVLNISSEQIDNIAPSAQNVAAPVGVVNLLNGPTPATLAALSSGNQSFFTWTYSASGSGTAVFTGSLQGDRKSVV